MMRAAPLAITAFLLTAGVAEASPAPLAAEAQLIDRTSGIQVISGMVLPSVTVSALNSAAAVASITSVTASQPAAAGNASLRLQGQAGQTVSMAVPESFQVVRNGGSEALTVRTSIRGISDGVLQRAAVGVGETVSIDIGGAVAPFGLEDFAPGAYQGDLVLVVQYN